MIIVIAAIVSNGNGVKKLGSGTTPPAGTSPNAAAQSSPAPANVGPVGTGFSVTTTGDNGSQVKYDVTLNKVDQNATPSDEFNTAPSGDHLAAAEFTITGVSGQESADANSNATATMANAESAQWGVENVTDGTNFNSGEFSVGPGQTAVGWVTFEVPDGQTITQVQWAEPFSTGAPATWTVS